MINEAALWRVMPNCSMEIAQDFADKLEDATIEFDIATPQRVRFFLAQIAHESCQLRYTREIWGPTAAQRGYEGRHDLGNTEPGDGLRFLGRGLIQITGRANYKVCSQDLFGDWRLLEQPELLEDAGLAARSAAWFWQRHGLNELADAGDFVRVTLVINGSTRTVREREVFLRRAEQVIV